MGPRHLLGHHDPGTGRRTPAALPGLAAVALATVVAFGVARLVPAVNPSTVAVVLGALAANLGLHRPVLHAGTHVASHRLLRIAVVLLGLQLGAAAARRPRARRARRRRRDRRGDLRGDAAARPALRVPRARALLVATGFSICGASAVAAMSDVAEGDEDDTAVAIALVTLCGSLAIIAAAAAPGAAWPGPRRFGSWVGASVHDVGQTVATADRVPGALTTAVVVKLSRVVLLAPLVAGVGLAARRRRGAVRDGPRRTRRAPIVPLFVVGFLVAIGVASTRRAAGRGAGRGEARAGGPPRRRPRRARHGIHRSVLRRTGGRALLLGLVSWVLVAGTAYLGVRLVT